MNENCEVCEFLKNPKHQVLLTDHWSFGLGNNQAYMGRAYVTLREHKGSLGKLSQSEWREFEELVQKLEKTYKKAFGAEPLNWGCFMNNAFRKAPFNPHVHWHIFPRYEQAPEMNGSVYDDLLYGEHYDPKAVRLVDDDVVDQIAATLREYLSGKKL